MYELCLRQAFTHARARAFSHKRGHAPSLEHPQFRSDSGARSSVKSSLVITHSGYALLQWYKWGFQRGSPQGGSPLGVASTLCVPRGPWRPPIGNGGAAGTVICQRHITVQGIRALCFTKSPIKDGLKAHLWVHALAHARVLWGILLRSIPNRCACMCVCTRMVTLRVCAQAWHVCAQYWLPIRPTAKNNIYFHHTWDPILHQQITPFFIRLILELT